MSYVGLVCARGGSKGLPGKNAKVINGKSLIGHAVAKAVAIDRVQSVFVSTDCGKLSQLAQAEGGHVPFLRPEELARDTSPEWQVWRHTIEYLSAQNTDYNGLLVVPPTAPLRSEADIEACLDLFETDRFDVVVTVTDAARSPYFNMVKDVGGGLAELVIKPDKATARRQDVPTVFDMTTVAYVARPEFVLSAQGLFDGRVGYVHIPPERAIDIDTQLDFDIACCIAASGEKEKN